MGDTQELGERRTQQILMRALGAGGFVARVGEAPVCAARVRRGGDFEWRACEAEWGGVRGAHDRFV